MQFSKPKSVDAATSTAANTASQKKPRCTTTNRKQRKPGQRMGGGCNWFEYCDSSALSKVWRCRVRVTQGLRLSPARSPRAAVPASVACIHLPPLKDQNKHKTPGLRTTISHKQLGVAYTRARATHIFITNYARSSPPRRAVVRGQWILVHNRAAECLAIHTNNVTFIITRCKIPRCGVECS